MRLAASYGELSKAQEREERAMSGYSSIDTLIIISAIPRSMAHALSLGIRIM